MKTLYDVIQVLKRYGTFIYTKNRQVDLDMMEDEIKELYHGGLLDNTTYQQAILILRQTRVEERNKEGSK